MNRRIETFMRLAPAMAALVLVIGCSDSDNPTGPTPVQSLTVASASVSANGQVFGDGAVFHHNHGQPGGFTRFEAHLWLDGFHAPGEVMQVRYGRPQGMGMMSGPGMFQLYDDGTHGDRIAGDGIYCLKDPDGAYGFHHAEARHGQYRYEFYGFHHTGLESNHRVITVTVAD